MNELFLMFMNSFFSVLGENLTTITLAIICNCVVVYLTILCSIIALYKRQYTVLKRLWIIFDFVAICIVQFWLELQIDKQITYLPLTIVSCFFSLSICLFLPVKEYKISQEKRSLAQFLDRCAHNQNYQQNYKENPLNIIEKERTISPSKVFSSPIISANQNDKLNQKSLDQNNQEIDFSHIKGILTKLEYYPLKEQDKKSAKDLEKAILEAEENGMDKALKQTINDGLGALLKIMAKYAV